MDGIDRDNTEERILKFPEHYNEHDRYLKGRELMKQGHKISFITNHSRPLFSKEYEINVVLNEKS